MRLTYERMSTTVLLLALLAPDVAVGHRVKAQEARAAATDWPSYGSDKASSKYSALAQIGARELQSPEGCLDMALRRCRNRRAHPAENVGLGVHTADGRRHPVYQHFALPGRCHRRCNRPDAVGLRPGDVEGRNALQQWLRASGRRLLGGRGRSTHPVGTGDGYLICLDAETGKPIPAFGQQGRIDLTQGWAVPSTGVCTASPPRPSSVATLW